MTTTFYGASIPLQSPQDVSASSSRPPPGNVDACRIVIRCLNLQRVLGGRHTTRHRRRRRVSSACVHATRTRSNKRTHFLKPTADDQALGECFCQKHLPLSHATKSRCNRVAQAAGGPAHTDFSPQKHRRLLASFALITHHSSVTNLSFLFHSEETRRPY